VPLNTTINANECLVAAVNFTSPKDGLYSSLEINLWETSAPNQGSNLKYIALGSQWFGSVQLLNDPAAFDQCDDQFDSDTCWSNFKNIGEMLS